MSSAQLKLELKLGLVLIVLTDSTLKMLYYMRSCGVNFEKSKIFRFLTLFRGGFVQENLCTTSSHHTDPMTPSGNEISQTSSPF